MRVVRFQSDRVSAAGFSLPPCGLGPTEFAVPVCPDRFVACEISHRRINRLDQE